MAALPAVPSVPDSDRYVSVPLTTLTATVPVPFPIYGDAEDLTVLLDGAALSRQSWGFSSGAPGLPIEDGLINLLPPAVGQLEIIGDWQPRHSMGSAPGIVRREFNQVIGGIVSGVREIKRALRTLIVPGLTPTGFGPLAARPAAGAVKAGYVHLVTDDASGRVVFYIGDGAAVWSGPLVGTGPQGLPGANGSDGLNGTSTSLKNRLLNGTFSIYQRSYVTATALAAGAYAHDRWKAGAGGANYTFTQGVPDTLITIVAGTLQQVVDNSNVEGGSYALSWTGTAQGRINAGSYANSPIIVTGIAPGTSVTSSSTPGRSAWCSSNRERRRPRSNAVRDPMSSENARRIADGCRSP